MAASQSPGIRQELGIWSGERRLIPVAHLSEKYRLVCQSGAGWLRLMSKARRTALQSGEEVIFSGIATLSANTNMLIEIQHLSERTKP